MKINRSRQTAIRVVMVIGVAAFTAISVRYLQSQPTPVQALTIVRSEIIYKAPDQVSRTETSIEAVRSDGSRVTQIQGVSPNGRMVEKRTVVNAQTKSRTVIDGMTQSKTTYPAEGWSSSAGAPNCGFSGGGPARVLGTGELLGFQVIKVEQDRPADNGVLTRTESWLAPALNCLPLKETLWMRPPDREQFNAANIRQAISVALGEPDSGLFQIPEGYVERSPREVFAEFDRRYPGAARQQLATTEAAQMLDQAYQSSRNKPR